MTPFLSRPKRLPCSNQKGKSKMAPSVAGSGFLKIFVLLGILLTVQAQREYDLGENGVYVIIGCVAVGVIVSIVFFIILFCWGRKAKSGSSNTRAPKEERVNRDTEANESMIKSPVYKPRGDQVRTADSSEPRNYREDRRSRGSEV